ncbi:hypothetical protein DHEL01_v212197 [Diaporthe helianthi]|uniref:Uncharacterized protein n=1 Tax=Diaporthe helianthi TaxID=158607 RepID=A0A2P5HGN0_DIAHE|nr:hypothetical protein DHEL01_v212197 [Diaporthe helianthi]
MAIVTGWYGWTSLVMLALFFAIVAPAAVPDIQPTNQDFRPAVLQFLHSFDAKCGCNQTSTVTCTPVVLTTSSAATNVTSYQMVEPSQNHRLKSTTFHDQLVTYSAYDCNGTITTFAETVPTATATSSSQTVSEDAPPTVAPSTSIVLKSSIPGASSTSSFSNISYTPASQSANNSAIHWSTMSKMSSPSAHTTRLSAYGVAHPPRAVPLVPYWSTESQAPPLGASSNTTTSSPSAMLSIPTHSTVTVTSVNTSSQRTPVVSGYISTALTDYNTMLSSTSSSRTQQPRSDLSPTCNPKPSHTNPDAPIFSKLVTLLAGGLCDSDRYVAGSIFTPQTGPISRSSQTYGVEYNFNITWSPDKSDQCTPMPEGQLLPSIEDCKELLVRNYEKCDNGGFGGWTDEGCLRFAFMPVLVFARR